MTTKEPLVLKAAIMALVVAVANLVAAFGFEVDGGVLAAVDAVLAAGLALLTLWGRSDLVLPGTVSPATDTARSAAAFQAGREGASGVPNVVTPEVNQ